MCVALPGRVISVNGNTVRVDFRGSEINAQLGLVHAKVGDYVLVHAGCVLQVLPPEEAEETARLFDELFGAEGADNNG